MGDRLAEIRSAAEFAALLGCNSKKALFPRKPAEQAVARSESEHALAEAGEEGFRLARGVAIGVKPELSALSP